MAAIFQTTFSNAFSWMKMFKFRLRFHWRLFPRVQLTIFQHWFRKWLGAGQATSHYLNQWWLDYWRMYASLGLNELIKRPSIWSLCHDSVIINHTENIMTSSNGNISALLAICAGNSPVPGEFPAQRPVTRNFDVFFDLRPNKLLSKQSRGWWIETPLRTLWRHRNELDIFLWKHRRVTAIVFK